MIHCRSNMKRIRDRKLTPLLKDQLATQEIRINEAGNNAYQDYINPKETGTIFKAISTVKSQQKK